MILKCQTPKDQLLFEVEIERVAKRNKKTKTKERQGADEAFFESWERFKMMLRKCPNHGFEDIAQLSIFLNGLRSNTKMLIDVVAGGTMMVVDVEQATRIIDALA